jgi:hypothetical protein
MKAQYIHATGVSLSGETYKILPLSDIIDIDQLFFHGFTKSQIDNIIEFNNKLSSDDLKIDDLTHEVRRLRQELECEKSNFKSFREAAINNVEKAYFSQLDLIED